MEQKNKITCLQELFDWIENSTDCHVFDKEDDNFSIEALNNAVWQIQFEKDDNIDDIIVKAIKQLEKFDADEEFMDLWSKEFSEHNHLKPSRFIKILQEEEDSFRDLARGLEDVCHE